ncbi:MAG: glycoside hydrolase family 73 protein [Terriglobales bacterium]
MTREEFLAAATRAALACSRATGFPPGITVAQAALESNWGQSRLSRDAHNYFGIKAHGNHARVAYPTLEHMNGRDVRVSAEFARYDSMEECFADRDRLIATAPCYAGTRACGGDPEAFTRALAAHWATDPEYATKLLCLYRTNGLDQLDLSSPDHQITRSPDSKSPDSSFKEHP